MCFFISPFRQYSPQPKGHSLITHSPFSGSRWSWRFLTSPTHSQPFSWWWQRTLMLLTCRWRCLLSLALLSMFGSRHVGHSLFRVVNNFSRHAWQMWCPQSVRNGWVSSSVQIWHRYSLSGSSTKCKVFVLRVCNSVNYKEVILSWQLHLFEYSNTRCKIAHAPNTSLFIWAAFIWQCFRAKTKTFLSVFGSCLHQNNEIKT